MASTAGGNTFLETPVREVAFRKSQSANAVLRKQRFLDLHKESFIPIIPGSMTKTIQFTPVVGSVNASPVPSGAILSRQEGTADRTTSPVQEKSIPQVGFFVSPKTEPVVNTPVLTKVAADVTIAALLAGVKGSTTNLDRTYTQPPKDETALQLPENKPALAGIPAIAGWLILGFALGFALVMIFKRGK